MSGRKQYVHHNNLVRTVKKIAVEYRKYISLDLSRFSLNVTNTNVRIRLFDNRRVSTNLYIIIDGLNIGRVYVAKYLGAFIDCNLNWTKHVINLSTKLSKRIAIIRKASHALHTEAIYILHCAIILPYLKYYIKELGNTYYSVNILVTMIW